MTNKWQYAVAGVAIGGSLALTLHLCGIIGQPMTRILGPALVLIGGLAGGLISRLRAQ